MTTYLGPQRRNILVPTPKFRRPNSGTLPVSVLPILGLDPGGTTGWSLLVIRKEWLERDIFSWNLDTILANKLSWEHGEVPTAGCEDDAVWRIAKLIEDWPSAAIVSEDFILRPERKEKSRELLSPVRITAKIETYLWRSKRRMFLQQPSQAKSTITDERLKFWSCYTSEGGMQHARDADRHVLLFLRRLKAHEVPLSVVWPHIYTNVEVSA
jgi:hypothetical protein